MHIGHRASSNSLEDYDSTGVRREDPFTKRAKKRYSCVSLITELYKSIKILLIVEDNLLKVFPEEDLEKVYNADNRLHQSRIEELHAELRSVGGKVLLPGYVVNSLARAQPRLAPFSPQPVHAKYP